MTVIVSDPVDPAHGDSRLDPVDRTVFTAAAWHPVARIAFRFAFIYLIVFNLPFPIDQFIDTDGYTRLIAPAVIFFARHALGFNLEMPPSSGSGDTTFAYVTVLFMLVLAGAATIVWSILDRKRENYATLLKWLMLYVRLELACTLVLYGAAKVIPSQFLTPGLGKMLQSYGDASPMGLLWTFMGASKTYTIFTGSAEMLAGMLLFVPRFITLGALISFAVFTNVWMLNMSYDVPVKINSFHDLVMSAFLLIPEIKGLMDFMIFRRAAQPVPQPPMFTSSRLNRAALAIQIVFGLYVTADSLWTSYGLCRQYGDLAPRSPYYGIWTADEFTLNDKTLPPLLTDKDRWQQVIFERPETVALRAMDGKMSYFKVTADAGTLSLQSYRDENNKGSLTVGQPTSTRMILSGTLHGQKIHATLTRLDENGFLLRSRGFHWINEYPFNR